VHLMTQVSQPSPQHLYHALQAAEFGGRDDVQDHHGGTLARVSRSLQNDDRGGEALLVRQADVRLADNGLARPGGKRACQPDCGGTPVVGDDLDCRSAPACDPGVQGLEICFFRGETRGERLDPVHPIGANPPAPAM